MSLTGRVKGRVIRGAINRLYELRGYSAYEIAVLNGFEGTEKEWLESLDGGVSNEELVNVLKAELGDKEEVFSDILLAYLLEDSEGYYLNSNEEWREQEGCAIYAAPGSGVPVLDGKTVTIRTYMYGDMAMLIRSSNNGKNILTTNKGVTEADIAENPALGIFEYVYTFTDFNAYEHDETHFRVSFCKNPYMDKPEISINPRTVWEEIKEMQFGTVMPPDAQTATWGEVRNAVRQGRGSEFFPIGHEFVTLDSTTGSYIVWVVRGHNHHKPDSVSLSNSMTLEAKYVYGNASGSQIGIVFDAPEAFLYAEETLSAGTYTFRWNYDVNSVQKGNFYFTLTQNVPAGGQVCINAAEAKAPLTSCSISTYGAVGAIEPIETNIVISAGATGTYLGEVSRNGSSGENINCGERIVRGSNNYAQSAVRQWLNSASDVGFVWSPKTRFDRPPKWANTTSGFLYGLPQDFLDVVHPAAVPCATNNFFEVNNLDGASYTAGVSYTLNDKFFILSRPEIKDIQFADGTLLEYYQGASNRQRIKYDESLTPRYCFVRSAHPEATDSVYCVSSVGSISNWYPYEGYAIAPACIIA